MFAELHIAGQLAQESALPLAQLLDAGTFGTDWQASFAGVCEALDYLAEADSSLIPLIVRSPSISKSVLADIETFCIGAGLTVAYTAYASSQDAAVTVLWKPGLGEPLAGSYSIAAVWTERAAFRFAPGAASERGGAENA